MEVCDKCRGKIDKKFTLTFTTKKFDVCSKCALRIVNWLERPNSGLAGLWGVVKKKAQESGGFI